MLSSPFKIMGIVNLTEDSFSDGGLYFKSRNALKRIEKLQKEGADIIDLGAESTRPGAKKIPLEEEWSRLKTILDFLEKKNSKSIKISIDTRKPEIARRVIDYDIKMINHIAEEPFEDNLLKKLAEKNISYLGMHIYKNPETMQNQPLSSKESLLSVEYFFQKSSERLTNLGFKAESIWLDPGIGFGKSIEANLLLMKQVREYSKKYNILMGISRKSWIEKIFKIKNPLEREPVSKITELMLTFLGAQMIRTHDVGALAKLRDYTL